VVPAFVGSGSNLKTFEALFSGRPVVLAESAAHRANLKNNTEGVFMAPNPLNAAQQIVALAEMQNRAARQTIDRVELIRTLGWAAGCTNLVNKLVNVDEPATTYG
jgi:hypothetical protein